MEASPVNFEKMVVNRPDAINVHAALCFGESIKFQLGDKGAIGEVSATGGVAADMSDYHKENWAQAETIDVPCKLVTNLLVENGIDHVDVFYLDVEGGELSVLETIEWGKVPIDMFIVEADYSNPVKDEAVRVLLRSQGYIARPFSMAFRCSKMQNHCHNSDLFVKKDIWEAHQLALKV